MTNPLLSESKLPHHAIPFNEIKDVHYLPALEEAIKVGKEEIKKIKENKNPPTFANTLEAMEESGLLVEHVSEIFFNLFNAESSSEISKLAGQISPKIAEYSSDITLDADLFARVKSVYESKENLNFEQQKLLEKVYKSFIRNGALLSKEKKEELREIDQKLAKLSPAFSQNVLDATNAYELHITDESKLSGMPENVLEEAKSLASSKGKSGYLFTLQAPSYVPLVTYCPDAQIRKEIFFASRKRCFNDKYDNQSNCKEIALLRFKRAKLLGYDSHAHYVLEERMAKSPNKVSSFLHNLMEKIFPTAKKELKELQDYALKTDGIKNLEPWDLAYYSEKLKKEKFQVDDELLRPYFKLENVTKGIFEVASKLYGISFKEEKLPVYHEDVQVYSAWDNQTKEYLGLFYTDFFPRKTKRPGGWMTLYRTQGLWKGQVERPHVSIVCNFTKPTASKPSLLTLDEVRTFFHEFGHALHGLLSNCTYRSLASPNVYWDFVELPSQIMENWVLEPEVLDMFAHHYETGEKIPRELIHRIKESQKFMVAYAYHRQLSFGIIDMAWHDRDPSAITHVENFEKNIFDTTRLFPHIPDSGFSTTFSHIFAGGYAAGYYSYKWAEVLDADAFEYFKKEGIFNPHIAKKFRKLLESGNTVHPEDLYREFRGRDPDPNALLNRDGLS